MGKLYAFEEFVKKKNIKQFWFVSENQSDYGLKDTCSFNIFFDTMIITEFPHSIMFKGDACTMVINRVSSIEYQEDVSFLGTIVHIYCAPDIFNKTGSKYTFIIS